MPKLGIDFISHNWFLDSLGVVSSRDVELVGLLFSIFIGESLIFLLLLINFLFITIFIYCCITVRPLCTQPDFLEIGN